jgi:integrase
MASLITRKNGRWELQWRTPDGRRPCVRLGKITQQKAEEFKRFVERIVESKKATIELDVPTRVWLASLSADMLSRLVKLGLIADQARPAQTLEELLDYCQDQLDVQAGTQTTHNNARHNLVDFFGHIRDIASITDGDAKEFRRGLLKSGNRLTGGGLSEATTTKRCQIARQFFAMAVDKQWLTSNPFACLKGGTMHNPERAAFISTDMVDELMDASPDCEWRLIIALARYGGLRCPSEVMKLRWEWVDWNKQTIRVHAPKTAHHRNHKWRTIPIFLELRPYLDAAWDKVPDGTDRYVIHDMRFTNQKLRIRMLRTIKDAGLTPWPRLWQNLRATRETELQDHFPMKCVTSWIGNSAAIAEKHYLQVTKDHIDRAVTEGAAKRCTMRSQFRASGGHRVAIEG